MSLGTTAGGRVEGTGWTGALAGGDVVEPFATLRLAVGFCSFVGFSGFAGFAPLNSAAISDTNADLPGAAPFGADGVTGVGGGGVCGGLSSAVDGARHGLA